MSDLSLELIAPSGSSRRTVVARDAFGAGARVHFAAWGASATVVFVTTIGDRLDAVFWEVPLSGQRPRLILRVNDPARIVR